MYCGSLERHRVLWPHLQHTIKDDDRVLHFAAEAIIALNIATKMHVNYTVADLVPSRHWLTHDVPVVQADITDQPWPEKSFDVIILSHVLEWVGDDARAMSELRRVIADDGVVVSQEPYDPAREATHEMSADERPAAVGDGPVRLYGRDLMTRWRTAGFETQRFHPEAGPDCEVLEARPRSQRS